MPRIKTFRVTRFQSTFNFLTLHPYSLQRTWSPPEPRLPKMIGNTRPRNYYDHKSKEINKHFLFWVEEKYCELNYSFLLGKLNLDKRMKFINRYDWFPPKNPVLRIKHFDEKLILKGNRNKLNRNLHPIATINFERIRKPSILPMTTEWRKSPKFWRIIHPLIDRVPPKLAFKQRQRWDHPLIHNSFPKHLLYRV